ncbi:unnamed protein product [Schistocephalus solidus]|uniref:Uncharacterized protein n=1 Tax=Schistocephalus solidus TaxID=70667 RepID=A0A183TRM4_SCHSO|nr:unnamed protein product [Schistocephalus solidus]
MRGPERQTRRMHLKVMNVDTPTTAANVGGGKYLRSRQINLYPVPEAQTAPATPGEPLRINAKVKRTNTDTIYELRSAEAILTQSREISMASQDLLL